MEAALRNRLTYGPMMLAAAMTLLWVDYRFEIATRGWMNRQFGVSYGIGGVGLLAIMLVVLPAATVEVARLLASERVVPYRLIAMVGSWSLAVHAFLTQFPDFKPIAASSMAFLIVFAMLGAALRRAMGRDSKDAIVHMAGTLLAMMYLGGLSWFLMAIRVKQSPLFEGQTSKIVFIMLAVKATDIGAYFGGRAYGHHKLISWLSPGKTWEGLFFGLVTAGFAGAVMAAFIQERIDSTSGLTWAKGAVFGIILGGIGQLGDLLESMMKRDAEVKDSGASIPGFGGVLDVIDSPLLAAPFAYLLFSLF